MPAKIWKRKSPPQRRYLKSIEHIIGWNPRNQVRVRSSISAEAIRRDDKINIITICALVLISTVLWMKVLGLYAKHYSK